MAGLNQQPLHGAYRGAAESWAEAASLAYVPMAQHLVARLGGRLPGPWALDVGAGTGAAGDALRELGAELVSVDLEHDMVAHHLADRGHAVVGDVEHLPLVPGFFDVVVAAFVLNHVADPTRALRELGRVTRSGGVVLASVFGADRSPTKEAVDRTLAAFGWVPPDWYDAVRERADRLGTVDQLTSVASEAGLASVSVRSEAVDLAHLKPELVVRYRLGQPQALGFVAALPADVRRELEATAATAVRATGEPFRPQVLELVAGVS